MKKVIWNILVALSVINLIWLFIFDYRIPRLPSLLVSRQAEERPETVEEASQEGEKTDKEKQKAETETSAGSEEITEAAAEVIEAEEETALASEETAETASEVTESEEEMNPSSEEIAETAPDEHEAEEKANNQHEPEPEDEGLRKCVVNEGYSARIRSGPGTDYEIVTEKEEGSILIITGEMEDDWYPVRSEDGTIEGYIYSDLVTMLNFEE